MIDALSVFVISAPSGAGKTSLIRVLVGSEPELTVAVSHTTRAMRPGETDGMNYHFVDQTVFQEMMEENEFLEYAKVFDHYYGTSRTAVEVELNKGRDVFLEIDWQGARQIRKALPGCVSIFVLPPSLEVLRARLMERGEAPAVIERRMRDAVSELSHYDEYAYAVINDDFDRAVADLSGIVRAERLKTPRQKDRLAGWLEDLIAKC